jgi:hypothetical protein
LAAPLGQPAQFVDFIVHHGEIGNSNAPSVFVALALLFRHCHVNRLPRVQALVLGSE